MAQYFMKSKASIMLLFWIVCNALPLPAYALIRDAETEAYIRDLSKPLFRAAGLSPEQVRMFIINKDSINAFVAGGSNMFLHTGMIIEAKTPEMLLGVIAHETGHITGGHLLRGSSFVERQQITHLLTYLLGAAAMAAGGTDVGAAVMAGASNTATRSILSYTRSNEQAADQAALGYFDQMQLSSEGMLSMFERLRREEKQHLSPDADQYYRSHPLSRDRITHIRNHLTHSPYKQNRLPASIQEKHQRIRAKLIGYLQEGTLVLQQYPPQDTSSAARVARAVAYSRMSYLTEASNEVRLLLTKHPDDAYMHELSGYILFHAGRIQESVAAYNKAHLLAPNIALISSDYAQALAALNNPQARQQAKELLRESVQRDPTYHQSWRLLAQIYGKEGNIGMAELSLAELAALNNDKEELLKRLDMAARYINAYSPEGVRLEDLRLFAKTLEDNNKDRL